MNDQDRDLILALAAGTLSEHDAAAGSALVASDPELAEELATQLAAIEASTNAPEVAMTAVERTELRSQLVDQLHLEPAAVPVASPSKRSTPWWQPVFGVAAVAVFVTAIIVVPGMFGSSDEFSNTAALTDVSTTVAASGGETEISPLASSTPTAEEFVEDEALEVDGADLLVATEGRTDPKQLVEAGDGAGLAMLDTAQIDAVERCLEHLEAELPDSTDYTPLGVDIADDDLIVFLAADAGQGVESVLTLNIDSCTIVDVAD